MASYLISYDLNRPGQEYEDLYEAIKSLARWWHNLDSTWIINHDGPATEIRDELKKHIDSSDAVIVSRLTGEAAWTGFSSDASDWLKDILVL